ncbi:ABC transporter ATP-binding protein [bacterium]|nr:ABC transporter ATP-binding protein [bacterium]
MSETVIKVENISKFYQLGLINHGTLAKDLQGWWAKLRGKEDPNSRISMVSKKSSSSDTDFIYALKDVSFDVQQGEVLGIIGANGAGKSTLLKILSRVTSPTSGCIKIKGRIGSLLEVGTGFHPELTGRENIYLNGAILGMRRHEIDKKLDEIIDFSGVEKFIDTPVKRYSSGMYVRLAFAVAAHLDPEILVVDEVLAVGDADFQKKCLGKMGDVSKKEGRTVLFVSHNMAAVRQLCTRGILLRNGELVFNGVTEDTVNEYLSFNANIDEPDLTTRTVNRRGNQLARFVKIEILSNGKPTNSIKTGDDISFKMTIDSKDVFPDVRLDLTIYDKFSNKLVHTNTFVATNDKISLNNGINIVSASFDVMPLQVGSYYINVGLSSVGNSFDWMEKATTFSVTETNILGTGRLPNKNMCSFILPSRWEQTND